MVVSVNVTGRGRASEAQAAVRVGHVWEMRDGKVLRFKIFPEREEALEAVGLSE